jgi:hypothetical protein
MARLKACPSVWRAPGGGSGGDSWYAGVWRRGEEGDLARARYPALVFVMKLRKKDGAPGMYADITRSPSPRCGLAVRSTGSDRIRAVPMSEMTTYRPSG